MNEYVVTVDFGDRTAPNVRVIPSNADLGGYLEQITDMIGFEMNDTIDIRIERRIKASHPRLI